jgi:SulP family sulfate permease
MAMVMTAAAVMAAAAVAVLNLDRIGVMTVGSIPRGLPPFSNPDFSTIDLNALLPAALGVTIVAYSDNIVTARAFATRRREAIDARQDSWPSEWATWPLGCFPASRSAAAAAAR